MVHPLAGATVLDLGQVYGGPYCSLLLAHLGARVIKVEPPPAGEPLRGRDHRADSTDESIGFQLLNGGKESILLDLKSVAGRESFIELSRTADILVENFAPGTTAKLGVDYPTLHEVNPRLIYASLKAYSSDSPHNALRGMDLTIQASSGVMSINGFANGPPVKCGPSLVDFLGGTHLAVAVLAALVDRMTTGHGQHVEVSLQDAVIPSMASNIARWLTDPSTAPERTGNHHGSMSESPYNAYQTLDGWICVLCITNAQWRSLCGVIGRQDLREDGLLSTAPGRAARMAEIDSAIEAWTSKRNTADVALLLQEGGVPASPVRTLAELMADETRRSQPMIQRLQTPDGTELFGFDSPIRMSDHSPQTLSAAQEPGAATATIFGKSADESYDGN